MFTMPAFCTDTLCQPTLPLINSNVNNVLFEIFPDMLCKMRRYRV